MDLGGPAATQAFALYAALGGALAVLGLLRDVRAGIAMPASREALLAALGLGALLAAFAAGVRAEVRLAAGGLLLAGLFILAMAPRRPERASPGRQVGLISAWAGIATALAGVLFSGSGPISPA